ncbi:hypothetical protein [Caballeronia arvi]|uniref:hypothetical protein n=1 Tax=Caballeronia arvi TaxID=1777135 RepID=UPI00117EB4AB|nr:hypothetical protein [Caballeronia arvi]
MFASFEGAERTQNAHMPKLGRHRLARRARAGAQYAGYASNMPAYTAEEIVAERLLSSSKLGNGGDRQAQSGVEPGLMSLGPGARGARKLGLRRRQSPPSEGSHDDDGDDPSVRNARRSPRGGTAYCRMVEAPRISTVPMLEIGRRGWAVTLKVTTFFPQLD